ncbi:MAG: DUF6378 domain-containing protein [Planctomycetota bacterium]
MKDYIGKASAIVEDRGAAYGSPSGNHGCTAELWNAFLRRKHGVSIELTPRDVCTLMVLQKVSRDAFMPKDDNWIDVIGYAANVGMIEDDKEGDA